MWPWEHAAVGYVLYSLGSRLLARRSPGDAATLVLALGTQLPDLVDKPLSWGLEWFPTGYAVGHSIFVAVPIGVLALVGGVRRGREGVAAAFVVGYWSHLLGDALAPLRQGEGVDVARLLWPVVENEPYARDLGLERGLVYVRTYLAELGTTDLATVLVFHVALPLATVVLWLSDGAPGLAPFTRRLRGVVRALTNG